MRETLVARVPSLSEPGTAYAVTRRPDGTLACACPAYGAWRKRGQPCWHLRVWQSADVALERCRVAGHQEVFAPRVLCQPCLLALLAAMAGAVKKRYVVKPEKKPRKKKGTVEP